MLKDIPLVYNSCYSNHLNGLKYTKLLTVRYYRRLLSTRCRNLKTFVDLSKSFLVNLSVTRSLPPVIFRDNRTDQILFFYR